MLSITLFGNFAAMLDNVPLLGFPTDATRALLAYLASGADQPHSRTALATLLWPDLTQKLGLQNLRTTLYRLRGVLGDKERETPFILADRRTIQFNTSSPYTLDVARFSRLYQEIEQNKTWSDPECRRQLETAVSLYHPAFIPELAANSSEFEAWRTAQEQQYQRQAYWLLDQLTQIAHNLNDFQGMAGYAQQQINLDPYNESGHQSQMRALMGLGKYQEACTHYLNLQQKLAEVMHTEPSLALTLLYQQIQQTDTLLNLANPYRGLDAFHEEDAVDFYGREDLVSHLEEQLAERPFVALIGPSGSGKTSVTCAGICPRLRRDGWQIIHLRPGIRPWKALAEAIAVALPHTTVTAAALTSGSYAPSTLMAEITANLKKEAQSENSLSRSDTLIVVDQFEELYTLPHEETELHAFITWLLAASQETATTGTCAHLLINMRADFMEQALVYRPLADALQPAIFPIGSMTRSELHRAITYPAANRRVNFQDGLVDRILDDVETAPGQLPLLQFALTRLWEEREENWLTHRAYESCGGVGGALSHHAQAFYDHLNSEQQQLARRIFLRLVQPGQGAADTSRPTVRTELPPDAWPLVQRLADTRLVVTSYNTSGQETAALAHEVLITDWVLLHNWLNEDRAFHTWQQRLDSARRQWQKSDQDSGALLRGALLSEAESWLPTRRADLSATAIAYIEASLKARDAYQQAEEAQRQQELAQAQALAEVESQRAAAAATARQRLGWLVVGLTVFLLISLLTAAVARQQWQMAQRAAAVAESLNLATSAQLALNDGHTEQALMLATEANRIPDAPPQAQRMLAEVAYAPGVRRVFLGHDGPVTDIAVIPGMWEQAVSAAADGTLILWDLETGDAIRHFNGHEDAVYGVSLLPQGTQALSASADGTLILWDVATGDMIRRWAGHGGVIWDVAVLPDCEPVSCRAISAGDDGTLILWDVATGDAIYQFEGHSGSVYTVDISPDGNYALSGSADHNVMLWEIETGRLMNILQGVGKTGGAVQEGEETPLAEGHRGPVRDVVFGRNGRTVYSVGEDLRLIHWDVETGGVLRTDVFNAALHSAGLSLDGRYMLLGRSDSQIALWSLYYGEVLLELLGHTSRVQAVDFSPDGRQAISGGADGSMRLWDLRSGAEMHAEIMDSSALDIAVSPDGSQLLLATAWGDLALWDYESFTEIQRLVGHTETPFAGALFRLVGKVGQESLTAVSGAGDVFGVAEDNTVRLWDVDTGAELERFEGHTNRLWDIDVSENGRFAVSGSHDGTVRLWGLEEETEQILADVSPQAARSVAFSPDGTTVLVGLAKGTSSAPKFSLQLLNSQTGELLRTFAGHKEIVSDIAFSADGRTALSGGYDKALILWDIETGQEVKRFEGHTGAINQVRFGPVSSSENEGQLALSAGLDNLIILWDVETGDALRIYRGHVGGVMSIAFAPDGESFFSVALDDSVRQWRVDPNLSDLQNWIDENRSVPEMTCEQKRQLGLEITCP